MAQATLATTPQKTEPNVNVRFAAEHVSVNVAATKKPTLHRQKPHHSRNSAKPLAQESFPGELAALRKQAASQHFSPYTVPNNVNDFAKKNSSHVFAHDTSNNNLLADQLIDVMPTGLVMLDGNGIVVKINQVARNLLDEPILGQPWFNVIARSFTPREDDWHEISLKDGRRVKLEITSLGSQPGQLIMITDLTETRLLQDKISQMQRLSSLGKMVSTLAHQIRTPLSAAILYGENLATSHLAEASRIKFQEKLNARLHDLEQQVNDMLLFSKSGTEQVVSPLGINELITDTVASMEALFIKESTNIKIKLADDEQYILGNKNALTGAIQNLLQNALRAMSTIQQSDFEPQITLQVYSQANDLYLSVKDNGPGIDAKISDKIFQPFYTSSSKGTGLGLSVVKSVVNAHQGEVNLLNESNKQNSGAHFVIKLPLIEHGAVVENSGNNDKRNTLHSNQVGEH
ncbi:HAMP domain-containing sensor histidine kinase [Colwellia sp. E2M01]|uniref:sensor histidine kinase n=1 Tax=Colwellia sp. E2M01 TaxID=2841561 RepID=UPI001C09BC65|nr:HAMP domain-containing sensor histidine kinase [Colwellia sp. E2M01]MBU2869957.1 HAMP domain-containing histidine kinase [Colwellia sp. E2M01]